MSKFSFQVADGPTGKKNPEDSNKDLSAKDTTSTTHSKNLDLSDKSAILGELGSA